MSQSRTTGTTTKITFPDGQEILSVRIEIDCPACGRLSLHLLGHHVLALQKLLADIALQHPTLIGQDDAITVLDRLQWQGWSQDPTNN